MSDELAPTTSNPEPAAADIDERDRRLLDYLIELAWAEALRSTVTAPPDRG
jgi:hypothetical protein